jgi:Glycosyl hydrolase family 76
MKVAVRALIAALVAGFVFAEAHVARSQPGRSLEQRRALASYAAMQRYFYDASTRSYKGTFPAKGHAQVWPYSQALVATLQLARVPRVGGSALQALPKLIAGLESYRHVTAGATGELVYDAVYHGHKYVFSDDNAWISLALLDASDVLHDRSLFAAGSRVFRSLESGWSLTARDACPGGLYWLRSVKNKQRGAVSTANAALVAALLYLHTHERSDLAWAKRSYEWTRRCLRAPSGLVADHIDPDGKVDQRIWSYNQGAVIATAVGLYQATHESHYLREAERTAVAALDLFRDPIRSGEPAAFLAIFYRDVLALAEVDRNPAIRAAVATFADTAWQQQRDDQTGLFHFGETVASLLDQAAMVQIYAALAAA